jgi:hypothetical protein
MAKTDSTRLMLFLAENAGPRPVVRRVVNGPIPREARRTFLIGLGLVILLVLIVVYRTPG